MIEKIIINVERFSIQKIIRKNTETETMIIRLPSLVVRWLEEALAGEIAFAEQQHAWYPRSPIIGQVS
jgi:hypothetical protein